MRFYSGEELRGALVFDSECLFYGRVEGLRLSSDDIYLEVYVEFRADSRVIDAEALVGRLEARGIHPERRDLEYLVALARESGVRVPYKRATAPYKMLKGLVASREILLIDEADLQRRGEEEASKIRVVLLSTPREARYRGLKTSNPRKLPEPGDIEDKLVISASKGLLGYAHSLVVGPGGPGLRVYKRHGFEGYINWIGFLNALLREGYRRAYEELSSIADAYRNPRLDLSWLERVKASIDDPRVASLLDEFIERRPLTASYTDIPWSSISRLGDCILVE